MLCQLALGEPWNAHTLLLSCALACWKRCSTASVWRTRNCWEVGMDGSCSSEVSGRIMGPEVCSQRRRGSTLTSISSMVLPKCWWLSLMSATMSRTDGSCCRACTSCVYSTWPLPLRKRGVRREADLTSKGLAKPMSPLYTAMTSRDRSRSVDLGKDDARRWQNYADAFPKA